MASPATIGIAGRYRVAGSARPTTRFARHDLPDDHDVNSEDGILYRRDLVGNRFSQRIRLTGGVGEAYTPTLIGADGAVYAISNATLFSIAK